MSKCETCIFDLNRGLEKEYKKNQHIFFEGDQVESIYRVKDGLVKLEKVSENGDVRIIDVLKEGDYLALLTVLNDEKEYKVTATPLKDSIITPISRYDANEAYQQNLHFKETCLKCAANRLGVFQGHTFNSSIIDVEQRILNTLNHLSKKFGYKEDGYTFVELPFSKTELANMVGLRRETLSRKLKVMQEDGILEVNKKIIKF